jgi:uncharacterized protein YggE
MGAARTDAETLAAAEDRAVGDAITITTTNAEIDRPVVHREVAAGGASGATSISPGDVTVDASVQVTYRLE